MDEAFETRKMKERLFQIKKKLVAKFGLLYRKLKRLALSDHMSVEESYNVPIVLNNRNRYSYLRNMVNWFQSAGYRNIYILDNDSTYPPLLDYYKTTSAKVIFLNSNLGYKALWKIPFYKEIEKGYYVYSDTDLMPCEECPKEIIFNLYKVLRRYPAAEKCGPALKINDLPAHYMRKKEVEDAEAVYWRNKLEGDVYDAPIDTTFALYKPFAFGNAEECQAIRVSGALTFRHLPWYENSANPTEENIYYAKHASHESTVWYRQQETEIKR